MIKNYIFLGLFSFLGLSTTAQEDFEWEWAKRGGGIDGMTPSPSTASNYYDDERIMGIAIDQQNNYFFLAMVGKTETDFDGTDFTTYNAQNFQADTYMVSTDCQGNFRWQKTIGSPSLSKAKSIGTDELGGVYVAGWAFAHQTAPLHFDTDSITTVRIYDTPNPSNKNIYLIKYDTEGNFQWLRQPQKDDLTGAETSPAGQSYNMVVEPDGTVHWLCMMGPGSNVNGNVVVPDDVEKMPMVLKYDKDGNFLEHIPAPVDGVLDFDVTQFHYDRLNNQYYVGGFKRSSSAQLFFDGNEINGSMFIGAFDAQGNALWYHQNELPYGAFFFDIETDEDSNVYFTGLTNNYYNDNMAGYTFTQSNGSSGTNAAFLIKLDPNGSLIWGTNADETCRYAARTIAINGDEVAIGLGLAGQIWDGIVANRPTNHVNDPAVVRFNKSTGDIIAIEDIMGTSGYDDEVTALAVDNNGNYIVGGIIKNTLFTDHPTVPIMYNSGGPSDFFVAQLAHTTCTQTSSVGEENFSDLKIYPNPTSGMLYVQGGNNLKSYKIYSMLGQTVAQGQFKQEISMENLNTGIYFIELQDAHGNKEVKRVVRK